MMMTPQHLMPSPGSQDAPLTHGNTGTALTCRNITAIYQGTFRERVRAGRVPFVNGEASKNFAPIYTVEWFTGSEGGWMELPTISGNCLRGRPQWSGASHSSLLCTPTGRPL